MGTNQTDKNSKAKATTVKTLKPKQETKDAGKEASGVKGGRRHSWKP
jgi:hypothetical protein